MSAGSEAAASDRKARLAAKAARQSQKPLRHGGGVVEEGPKIVMGMQHQSLEQRTKENLEAQFQVQPQQQQPIQVQTQPSAQKNHSHHHHQRQQQHQQYQQYDDSMDDMDATLYLDHAPAKSKSSTTSQSTSNRSSQPSSSASSHHPQHSQHPIAVSPNRRSQNWEDEVESFEQTSNTPSHLKQHSSNPRHQQLDDLTDEPSPNRHAIRSSAVLTLDSAAEEKRLDALRAKGAKNRNEGGAFEESISDISPLEQSMSLSTIQPQPYTGGGSGWVDPSTRLVSSNPVHVRARSHQPPPQQQQSDQEDQEGEGQLPQRDQQTDEQPYLREQRQAVEQQKRESEAIAASSTTATSGSSTDAGYQLQLKLQAEQAAYFAQKAANGSLSAEEQRIALMRSKRPPLILDWARVDPKAFFNTCAPRGGWVQCRLIKRSAGFASFLHPRYEFYTEEHQGGLFLATARKSSKTKPNYHLTTEKFAKGDEKKSIEKSSEYYAGKVAATLSRSDYIVYDGGFNPSKSDVDSYHKTPREEIGHISYKPHLSGKTPRKLAVLLPILFQDSHKDPFIATEFKNEFLSSSSAYQHLWKNLTEAQQKARIPRAWLCLLNKPPRYHADTGQYVLDFCGRAPQVSVKNFQLVYPEEPDEVLFQLGRLDDENFSVDFRFPMAPIQAFAIALSSLDYKWTVD